MMPGTVATIVLEQERAVPAKGAGRSRFWRAAAAHWLAFALRWAGFWRIFDQFPYLATGADVVYHAKTQVETSGVVFPRNLPGEKLIIFGNSRVLAGFVPEYFDRMASEGGGTYLSFNSGFPARDGFVPELAAMVRRGQIPDVVLLTQPWRESATVFKFAGNDHDLAEQAFPFRHLPRDAVSFLANSRSHGGLTNSYRLSEQRARNRVAVPRLYLNLMLTFMLSGLWHGASWNFVIWGALHGSYMAISRLTIGLRARARSLLRLDRAPGLLSLFQVATTFAMVCLGWIFFRATNFASALYIASHAIFPGRLHVAMLSEAGLTFSTLPFLLASIAALFAVEWWIMHPHRIPTLWRHSWIRLWGYQVCVYSIIFFGGFGHVDFIYFKF